jgi:hypothetical protein
MDQGPGPGELNLESALSCSGTLLDPAMRNPAFWAPHATILKHCPHDSLYPLGQNHCLCHILDLIGSGPTDGTKPFDPPHTHPPNTNELPTHNAMSTMTTSITKSISAFFLENDFSSLLLHAATSHPSGCNFHGSFSDTEAPTLAKIHSKAME